MGWFRASDVLDRAFLVGIVLKGLDGLVELVGGFLLLFASPETINRLVVSLTRRELSEDPDDAIATYLRHVGHGLTGSVITFTAGYLLFHGVVKIVLVVAVLRDRRWAYPWMIGFLVLFIVYQMYRMTVDATLGLAALTVFDAAVVWLTYREYRKRTK